MTNTILIHDLVIPWSNNIKNHYCYNPKKEQKIINYIHYNHNLGDTLF
jgi:hypothetical protein